MARITERIDRITRLADEVRSATPPAPRSVKIELTARCDFQCFFCASRLRLRDKGDIDPAFFRRVLAEMRALGVEEIGLFYLGESFLCAWLPEAIRYAKRDCGYPYVFLTTNGRLATPERVRECMAAGLDSLKFSFNFADSAQFMRVTNVRARDFHTVENNLRDAARVRKQVLEETGHSCGLYASSILYDGEQQARMEAAVARILPYVDEHYWLPLTAGSRRAASTTTGASTWAT